METMSDDPEDWDWTIFDMTFFHSWVLGREWRMRNARVSPSKSLFIPANQEFLVQKKATSSVIESPSIYWCSTSSIFM